MAAPLKIASAFNHVAFPAYDTAETRRFYTEVLGLRLAGAVRGETDPRGRRLPHLHTFYATENGECIAFFDFADVDPEPHRDGIPGWGRHIAMGVDSHESLLAWQRRLRDHGVETSDVVDHDGVWYSIYFPDPNGLLLELTYQARALDDDDARRAVEMVEAWVGEHGRK